MYSWLVLPATTALANAFLNILVFFCFSLLTRFNLPLVVLRSGLFILKAVSAFAVACWAFSLHLSGLSTLLTLYIVLVGRELGEHLRKRTTAAYSTSDSQNQRLFNFTILIMTVCGLLAWGVRAFAQSGLSFFWIPEFNPGNRWQGMAVVFGLILFFRYFYLVLSHYRTLLYLVRSYWEAGRKGKISRFW